MFCLKYACLFLFAEQCWNVCACHQLQKFQTVLHLYTSGPIIVFHCGGVTESIDKQRDFRLPKKDYRLYNFRLTPSHS